MKRVYVALLLVTIVLLASGATGISVAGAAAGEKTNLVWFDSGTSPERDAAKARIIAEFEKLYPDITVEAQHVAEWNDYYPKLTILITSGVAPDIAFNQSPSTIAQGLFMDLDPLVKADKFDLNLYNPVAVVYGRLVGKPGLFTLPNHISTIGMYYNTALFDEAGIPRPNDMFERNTWTWDTYSSISKKLQRKDDSGQYTRQMINWLDWTNILYEHNATVFDSTLKQARLDTPEARKAFQVLQRLWAEDRVIGPGYLDGFASQRLVMVNEWTSFWRFDSIAFDWDVAPYPAGDRKAALVGYGGYAIPFNSAHPQEAWLFLKFLLSEQAQLIFSKGSGDISAHKAVATKLYSDDSWGPKHKWQAFVAPMMDYGVVSESYLSPIWGKAEDIFWNTGAPLRNGTAPANTVAEQLNRQLQAVLDAME